MQLKRRNYFLFVPAVPYLVQRVRWTKEMKTQKSIKKLQSERRAGKKGRHYRLLVFFPLLAIFIAILVVIFLPDKTLSAVLDSFALSFTSVFIFSLLGEDEILHRLFRLERIQHSYPYAKGALIRGRQINIIITAIVDFIAGTLKLLN